jgi:hypothetical protein
LKGVKTSKALESKHKSAAGILTPGYKAKEKDNFKAPFLL